MKEDVSSRSAFWRGAAFDSLLWLLLLGLLAASLLLALGHRSFGFVGSLAIALAQIVVLALFFLQLRSARPLILLAAAASLVFVFSLFTLSLNDLLTR